MFSKFFAVLLALFAFNANAANVPQAANVVQYGGSAASAGASLLLPQGAVSSVSPIVLSANTASQTNGNFLILYKGMSGAAYQVTAGKTFYVTEIQQDGGAVINWQFCTGTAAVATNDSNTAPTGVVYQGGASGKIDYTPGGTYWEFHIPQSFAATLYPCIQTNGGGANSGHWLITGFEI